MRKTILLLVMSMMILMSVGNALITDGLVNRFPMTSDCNDVVGGITCTPTDIDFGSGTFGSFSPDISSYGTLDRTTVLSNMTEFTYCNKISAYSLKGFQMLWFEQNQGSGDGIAFTMIDNKFHISTPSTSLDETGTSSANVTYNLCMEGSQGNMTIYKDGVQSGTSATGWTVNDVTSVISVSGANSWNGRMSEICIWNRKLTTDELTTYGTDGCVVTPYTGREAHEQVLDSNQNYNSFAGMQVNFTDFGGQCYNITNIAYYQDGTTYPTIAGICLNSSYGSDLSGCTSSCSLSGNNNCSLNVRVYDNQIYNIVVGINDVSSWKQWYKSTSTGVVTGTHINWIQGVQLDDGGIYPQVEYQTITSIDLINYTCPTPCVPNWSCDGYDTCQSNDTQNCNSVTDLNTCGEVYGGDYTEFTPQSCDYCLPDWSCDGYASCLVNDTQVCNSVVDGNTCYSLTGLESDQYSGDYTEFLENSCNYCTLEYSNVTGTCTGVTKTIGYNYVNYGSCCALTGIPADCNLPVNGTIPCCIENWVAQYTSCSVTDEQVLTYNDETVCNTTVNLPVDNGTTVSCNYCTLQYNTLTTACVGSYQDEYAVYDNYGICCNLTGIPVDCTLPSNSTVRCGLYAGMHSTNDITGLVIDIPVEIGISALLFVPLIAIIVLGVWALRRIRK